MRKFLATVLVLVMVFSIAGCSSKTETTQKDTSETSTVKNSDQAQQEDVSGDANEKKEVETVVFTFPVGQVVSGIQTVEDEINKITEEKINVHIKLYPLTWSDYSNQVALMQTSGDPLDLVTITGEFSSNVAKNQLLSMNPSTDILSGAMAAVGEEFLKATTVSGELFSIPTLNGKAAVLNIVLTDEALKASGTSLNDFKQAETFEEYTANLDKLSEIFAKIKAAMPDQTILAPSTTGSLMFTSVVPGMDSIGDGFGVLSSDGKKVVNFAETSEYATLLSYVRDWYEKGYILKDAATTTETSNTYLGSGRVVGYFITGEEGQAEQITNATGVPVQAVKLVQATIQTSQVNSFGFGISSTSAHPEAAARFINEMYVNADLVNLLAWGVEGEHYVVNSDGTVGFPEGIDATTTTYGLNMDWLFGNQFLGYIWGEGRDTSIYQRLDANNKNALYTPILGFTYDSTPIRGELTAVINVDNEFGNGLNTGTLDPTTNLPKYIEALKSAGIDVIIAEKQKQLDEWLKNN